MACGCPVVGGDVSRAASLVLAVTVFGRAAAPATRAGARPGDVLAVTGSLGGSEAGRLLLERDAGDVPGLAELSLRHRRPVPRLADGRVLAAFVHAMLDVSDGVASDARRLAEASGVRVEVDLDALPLRRAWPRWQPTRAWRRARSPPGAARTTSCWWHCPRMR